MLAAEIVVNLMLKRRNIIGRMMPDNWRRYRLRRDQHAGFDNGNIPAVQIEA